jgi:dihydrodipicolinate synthase/N-acetylneuraminate lyase
MKGVKEMLELIAGLKEVAKLGKLALKDGKIDLNDLALLSQLLVKQQVMIDALQGLGDVGDEVKDLSLEEAMQLIQALVDAAKEVKNA